MARPDKIETLENVQHWIYDHDARIDAWWEEQHRRNRSVDDRLDGITKRLSALERRIMWFCGAASAIGGIVGALLGGA